MIFDTHAHYDDSRFDADREEVLAALAAAGVRRVVNVAADMESVETTLALANTHDFIYAALGVHPDGIAYPEPVYAEKPDENGQRVIDYYRYGSEKLNLGDLDHIAKLAKENPKAVAIGEIGLDYYYETPARELQKKWFDRQAEMAVGLKLPIIVHSREAAKDTYDILRAYGGRDRAGIIHCFSYEKEMARQFLDLGYYIAIGGAVTFKNARAPKEVAAYVPADRLLLETDCPYMTPVPHRGERNFSGYLPLVAAMIAEVRGQTTAHICETTYSNANTLFGISD